MIRIIVVGEVRLYRDGLIQILNQKPELQIVASIGNWDEAYQAIPSLRPEIILLDMATQGSHEAVGRILTVSPETRVVALGVADLDSEIVSCVEAGVSGYVSRNGSLESLFIAIHGAIQGEMHCSARLAGLMSRRLAALSAERRPPFSTRTLTARETEILRLIDSGHSNKQIANRLGIEIATVKNHVHNLLEKLQVRRRGEAAAQIRSRASLTRPSK